MENIELLANAIILQAVKDYRHTYSPQCRTEIKRFFSFRMVPCFDTA